MKKKYSLDNIRGLAILMVVFGHSIIIYSSQWSVFTTVNSAPLLDMLKAVINILQMPLFFSLSGFLFYFTFKKQSFTAILKRKIFRLGIPFLVFSYCYLLPVRKIINYTGYANCSLTEIMFKKILLGEDNGHMWYLPTLFFCFMIAAILLKINTRLFKTVTLKTYFFVLILSGMCYISSFLINCSGYILYVFQYFFWFVLGLFMSAVNERNGKVLRESRTLKIIVCTIAVIGIVVTLLAHSYFLISTISGVFCVLAIFLTMPNKNNKILSILSKNSFGIYLIHSPLVYLTYTYMPNAPVLFVVILNFLIFGGLALLTTVMIRKTKLRFIVGEK